MKELTVNKTNTAGDASWEDVLKALYGAEWNKIDVVNWAEYDYVPQVQFRMVYSGEAFFLQYRVREQSVRAVAAVDNGEVWKDSCVEFFFSPADDGIYYNFEFNCAGVCLLAAGVSLRERDLAPQEIMSAIRRLPGLGSEPFAERKTETEWEIAVVIPYSCLFEHPVFSPEGKEIRANFYKCGDDLTVPHFLSWNPINTPKPDFHRPEFFGKLKLEA